MVPVWIDYSGGPVSGAAMAAAGITGAIRYVGIGGTAKRLTHAEYADHLAHGRQTIAVVERTIVDADGGYAAGKANAAVALTDLRNVTAGLDPIRYVLAANDKTTWNMADLAYVRGFRDVLAPAGYTVGPYGFGTFLTACAKAGLAPIAWQAGPAPSRTGTADVATFWQRQGGPVAAADGPTVPITRVIDRITCDLSNQRLALEDPVSSPMQIINQTYSVDSQPAESLGRRIQKTEEVVVGLQSTVAGLATSDEVAALATQVGQLADAMAAIQPSALSGTAQVTVNLTPGAQS